METAEHTNHILMSRWPVLPGRICDAFYLLSRVSLFAAKEASRLREKIPGIYALIPRPIPGVGGWDFN